MATQEEIWRRRTQILDILRRQGPLAAKTLWRLSGIHQSTFSRLVNRMKNDILVVGRGRKTRYAMRREIVGIESPIPVYEIRPQPLTPVLLARLHPVMPAGFLAADLVTGRQTHFLGLPWYLHDLAPRGFLGRQIPQRHHELGFPQDIRLWSEAQILRYLCVVGWDLPGSLIVGDVAYSQFLQTGNFDAITVESGRREVRYPEIADNVLGFGNPGSSAAGEQPKFLAIRKEGALSAPVLVKFSPPGNEPVAARTASLLVAENLATETMLDHGLVAVKSQIFHAGGRTFLEVERFDRQGVYHRRGMCSLESLDAEFVGHDRSSWSQSVRHLVQERIVPDRALRPVRLAEYFGKLIGNTDMHFGNLSFYMEGLRITDLAPIYDMLPMHYAPRSGEVRNNLHSLPSLSPSWGDVARQAVEMADNFWHRIKESPEIDGGLKNVATKTLKHLETLHSALPLLPSGSPLD